MADGIAYGNRITNFSHNEAAPVVVDAVLSSPTYWARVNGMGKKFSMPTAQYTVKVEKTNLTQAYQGLETLNSSASDTTIQLEFNHTAITHPAVKIFLENMAAEGAGEDINLSDFIDAEAVAEINEYLGTIAFATGTGKNPLGLEAIVDDGTNAATIGGQSRTTYPELNSTVTASGGTVSLAKMATLISAISSGVKNPSIGVTTETVWNLLEELLLPQNRGSYGDVGYSKLAIRGKNPVRSDVELHGASGFTAITYRGIPIIADEFATSGVLYFLNENYLEWKGRTSVPKDFKGDFSPISLGKSMKTLDVPYSQPTSYGWFYQKEQMMPNQAGRIGRYHVIGQLCSANPRYHGKLTGITGV